MTDQASYYWETVDGVAVVHVTGELDISNDRYFRSSLREVRPGDGTVVANLTGVSYLDSHAVAALIDALQRVTVRRGNLLVVAPAERPSGRLLRIAGVDALTPTFETLDDAIAHARRLAGA